MTKISRAYVVKTEWGEVVWIEGRVVRSFTSDDVGAAGKLCEDLNAWRENYAQGCIDQTISLMEEINDEVRTKAIAGS